MLDIPLMSNNIQKEDIDCLIDFLKTADRFTQGPRVSGRSAVFRVGSRSLKMWSISLWAFSLL